MGFLIDFQEAKENLAISQTVISPSEDLVDAVQTFAFSRLPIQHRISLILAGILGGEAESWLKQAAEIEYYASKNFEVPYKAPILEVIS